MGLIDDRIPVGKCGNKLYLLEDEEDPTVPAYGVGWEENTPYNLKIIRIGDPLYDTDPIILEYDRTA